MRIKEADAYFKALSKEVQTPLVLVLTGGIAAGIMAAERATDDIDFAILRYARKSLPEIEALLQRLAEKRGILIQYSSDIGRWSSVSFLDWKKHSRPYTRQGFLEVRVLDPYYWSIGKITRGTDRDLKDLEAVIRRQTLDWKKLAALWAKALRKSPPSTALFNVRKQMEGFLVDAQGGIFNGDYDSDEAVAYFRKLLIPKKRSRG
ncbi:MAG TPA: DUF6036 family nucleotidyltransferase [bacterium]|jgi:hypothetical protein|nr:DUF6036 family nucleotidyltransferase [bacterium]